MKHFSQNTSRVCYLELSFIRFDVEASAQCQFDYLEINNVRLCGSLAKETTRTYIFEGHEKMIRFHSDSSNTRSGFFIRVDQLECDGDVIIRSPPPQELTTTNGVVALSTVSPPTQISNRDGDISSSSINNQPKSCNQFFMSPQFEIRSPSYPRTYPPSIECIYYIKKSSPQVCRIEVTYHDFKLKSSDSNGICKYDYLDFNGIRMCGTINKGDTRLYYFPDNEFKLKFYTNDQTSVDGKFRVSLNQVDCQVNSLFSSPLDSVPRINNENNKSGHHSNQQQQSHRVSSAHHQQQQLSSSTRDLPQTHNCDQTFDLVAFEIKSPLYPNNYPIDVNCRYTINKATPSATGDPICQLEVNFVQHSTPTSDLIRKTPSSQCTNDYLTFENYGRVCGKVPPETVKFFPFDGSTFTIDFHSDRQRESDSSLNGFHLQVRQRECLTSKSPALKQQSDGQLFDSSAPLLPSNAAFSSDTASQSATNTDGKRDHLSLSSTQCGQMVSDIEFEIKSPYYPSSYSENVECVFTIRKNHHSICNIELRFIEFDVEESPHCTKDYLLMDGKKFCGRYKPNTYMNFDFTSSNEKIIYFKSDLESSRRGFLLTGKQKACESAPLSSNFIGLAGSSVDPLTSSSLFPRTPAIQSYSSSNSLQHSGNSPIQSAPSICEYCFSNTSGTITSYGYPRKYPANLDCNYKVSAMPGYCSLEINVETFNLPSDAECNQDYLQIDQNRYCSNQLQGATSKSNSLSSRSHF